MFILDLGIILCNLDLGYCLKWRNFLDWDYIFFLRGRFVFVFGS